MVVGLNAGTRDYAAANEKPKDKQYLRGLATYCSDCQSVAQKSTNNAKHARPVLKVASIHGPRQGAEGRR